MNIRSNKGITLISEVIVIIVLTIIVSVITYSSNSNIQIRKLNNMYADIVNIQEKASNYYLRYGRAPVTEETVSASIISKISSEKNPNDQSGAYYKIDYKLMNNLSLNNNKTSDSKYYFMNSKTLTTYYSDGVKIKDSEIHYTAPSNYNNVSMVYEAKYKE